MNTIILGVMTLASTIVLSATQSAVALLSPLSTRQEKVLAEHVLELKNREKSPFVNQVFADNILLSLHRLKNGSTSLPVDWEKIRQPFEVSFTLQPGESFAFHKNVAKEFSQPTISMNSRFFTDEGYKAVGGLGGNGVCHLASLITWVASDSGLEVVAKTRHNFAPVPGVPEQFGTSIRSQSPVQNLYIENNQEFPVVFRFEADPQVIVLKILQG